MKNKTLLTGIIVILFLVMQGTATAQEITDEMEFVLECPAGHRAMFVLHGYERTDFAFDNYTIESLTLNISTTSMVDIRVSSVVYLYGYNHTLVEVWRNQTTQCNLVFDDLFDEHEIYNSSHWINRNSNSSHIIFTYQYYLMTQYFWVEVENIGTTDTLVQVEHSMTFETYGDREVEMNVTLREPFVNYPPVTTNDPTTTPQYYRMEVSKFNTLMVGLFGIGGCIGALIMIVMQARQEVQI